MDSRDRGLVRIPGGAPTNTINLTLSVNRIREPLPGILLEAGPPAGARLLVQLRPCAMGAKNNVCTERLRVQRQSFTSLRCLCSLYLDGNQLLHIPRDLPSNLKVLSLEANHIVSIMRDHVTDLVGLELLYLGQNCYYRNPCNVSFSIATGAFWKLQRLSAFLERRQRYFCPCGFTAQFEGTLFIQQHDYKNPRK